MFEVKWKKLGKKWKVLNNKLAASVGQWWRWPKKWIFWAYCLLETISNRWFCYCRAKPKLSMGKCKNYATCKPCFYCCFATCLIGWIVAKFTTAQFILMGNSYVRSFISESPKWFSFFFLFYSTQLPINLLIIWPLTIRKMDKISP